MLAAAGFLAAACGQQAPAPSQVTTAPPSALLDELKREGDALTRQRDWEGAAHKYRTAVNKAPDDVTLRLALATALSHLDQRAETVEHFQWVLAHARPGSAAAQMAHSWLAGAGELSAAAATSAAPEAAQSKNANTGVIKGRTDWPQINPRDMFPVRIIVAGEDLANREINVSRRFWMGRQFQFPAVPPGRYRLTAQSDEAPVVNLWEQTVNVEAGKESVVDLTPSNSSASPSTFPPKAQ